MTHRRRRRRHLCPAYASAPAAARHVCSAEGTAGPRGRHPSMMCADWLSCAATAAAAAATPPASPCACQLLRPARARCAQGCCRSAVRAAAKPRPLPAPVTMTTTAASRPVSATTGSQSYAPPPSRGPATSLPSPLCATQGRRPGGTLRIHCRRRRRRSLPRRAMTALLSLSPRRHRWPRGLDRSPS
jgi:hypothetical protein